MTYLKYFCTIALFALGWVSCTEKVHDARTLNAPPPIFPDYTEVTVPVNIAPLNFKLVDSCACEKVYATFANGKQRFMLKANKGKFSIPISSWRKLLNEATGSSISVTVEAKMEGQWVSYQPFRIYVAEEPIDPWLAYRLIDPGYEVWNEMGIYQRCLENFTQSVIINNKRTGYNCMNCHSFCMQNPEKMMFHMRAIYPGTFIVDGDHVEKLNTKTDQTMSALVYPSWHPSGNYIAFSVNDIKQSFHSTDPNRVEVFDLASDVVVYDVNKYEIVTSSLLSADSIFETFPTFSPDGKTLFFCSSDSVKMPEKFENVKYSLCSISFDPENRRFGTKVDTLYQAKSKGGRSVSFPRVSPDGRFLMFTLSGYGNFSIWHKDADLYMYDFKNKKVTSLNKLNSNDVDSYHSWSSNSRWVVFSSRRIDGLYTRPFIAHIDSEGNQTKPFLLPQKDVDFYQYFMKSFNVPELIKDKVKLKSYNLSKQAMEDPGIDVKFAGKK